MQICLSKGGQNQRIPIYLIGMYAQLLLAHYYTNKMSQAFQQLKEMILSLEAYEEDSITDLEVAIQCLDQIYEDHSKDVAKKIDQLIDIFEVCLAEHPAVPLITISHLLDFIVGVASRRPKLTRNNKNRTIRLCNNFLKGIAKTAFEVEEMWFNPPDGYSEENNSYVSPDYAAEKQLLSSFDILAEANGRSLTASTFEQSFKAFYENQSDWRFPYAALILSSQLSGPNITLESLDNYILAAILQLENPHPKIRYASFHLIGQYSDEMKPDFQEKYFDAIVPTMIKLLQDPVPRVVAHDLACLTNFFDQINEVWKIEGIIGQVLPLVFYLLKNSNTWTKENCISTLSALATTKDAFGPNLTQVLEIANELIVTYTGNPLYTQLINQSFELLSFILRVQDKKDVEQYLGNFVSLMISNRLNMNEVYFLNAWNRLCSAYESFVDISLVFDSLMEAAQIVLESESDESIEEAIDSLQMTCTSFKTNITPYAQRLYNFAVSVFEDKEKQNDIRESAIALIVNVITATKCETPELFEIWRNFAFNGIQYISNSIDAVSADHYDEYEYLYMALKDLITNSISSFNQLQIQGFAQKLQQDQAKNQQIYNELRIKKQVFGGEENDDEVQSNESEMDYIEEDIKSIFYSMENIPEVYQSLLNVNDPANRQWLLEFIVQESTKYVGKEDEWKLFGINLTLTLVQKCTYPEIANYWGDFLNLYTSHSSHPHTRIRNSAVYGLGLMFLSTPLESIEEENVTSWLQSLWNAFSLPYGQDLDEGLMRHSRDNVISAIGKLLFKCGNKFQVTSNPQLYQLWLSKLPLNEDKGEGDIQQGYLISLLNSNPGMIVANAEDLRKVCIIYASFVGKRHDYANKNILNETKTSLKAITNWPLFKESQAFLWSKLTNSQINLLTRFISN